MSVPQPLIVGCAKWGAVKPRGRIQVAGRPDKLIIHHTAGHAAHLDGTVDGEFRQGRDYALMLQTDMIQRRGWIDSGHNYLVMRTGLIFEGRHGTTAAISHGRMVVSAHCPGENGNPGIEHEHVSGEEMTPEQFAATVALQAWIMFRTGMSPTRIFGHRDFYGTDCPDNLELQINHLRVRVARELNRNGRQRPHRLGGLRARIGARRAVLA